MKTPTRDEKDVAERVPDLSWLWASKTKAAKVERGVRSRFATRARVRVLRGKA